MLEDLRKAIEATLGELTPARAKSLAKSFAGPGAAKDQVAKSSADLIEWSQKNRERLKDFVRREVSSQMGAVGVATQAELDALKKRVRTLERAADKHVSASPKPGRKPTGVGSKGGTRSTAKGTGGGTRARG